MFMMSLHFHVIFFQTGMFLMSLNFRVINFQTGVPNTLVYVPLCAGVLGSDVLG